ncbi:MAG: hypothetical protein GX974_05070 [Clostridiales bacterium]|nr:hypothetical protein [Clostridiales bacterium]
MEVFLIFIAAAFENNFVLSQLLGIYPSISYNNSKVAHKLWEGLLMTLTTIVLAVLIYIIHLFVLEPLNLNYLSIMVTILLSFLIAHIMTIISNRGSKYGKKISSNDIVSNSIVLAVILFSIDLGATLPSIMTAALGAGIGYTLVSTLLIYIIDVIDEDSLIQAFRGVPIRLLSLGLMALAFWGVSGISF